MKKINLWIGCFLLLFATLSHGAIPKKWTILVYLNGNNSLSTDSKRNILEMERVGSNDHMNIVVQWSNYASKKTVRFLVKQNLNSNQVTSPILQEFTRLDMGSYKTLEDFVDWGVKYFPAEQYFLIVWNHGSGWHMRNRSLDISMDDFSQHAITTKELGQVMAHAAKVMGHKVDLYGSDACLMGMLEIANEMKDSVRYFVGSEDSEPSTGWAYKDFLTEMQNNPNIEIPQMTTILAETYIKKSTRIFSQATLSAFDVSKLDAVNEAMIKLKEEITKLDKGDRAKLKKAIRKSQSFDYSDYIDLINFLKQLKLAKTSLPNKILTEVENAAQAAIITNKFSSEYNGATGMSLWVPKSYYWFQLYKNDYINLKFDQHTHWLEALRYIWGDKFPNGEADTNAGNVDANSLHIFI